MQPSIKRWFVVVAVLLALSLVVAGTTLAQDETPPPPEATPAPAGPPPPLPPSCVADVATGTSCVKIVFYPATLYADLYLVTPPADPAADPNPVETPTEQVQQAALWVTFVNPVAGQTQTVTVKNIKDYGVGEGILYMYPDMPKTVTAPATLGTTSTVTLYPVKKYIRGTAKLTCKVGSVTPTDVLACQVMIDGAAQPDVPANASASYFLDPGAHTFLTSLVGENAALWSPDSVTQTVTISAGSTAPVAPAFLKKGHLVITLSEPDVLADLYVDGVLLGTQVATAETRVAPNKSHKVEAKNITDPKALGDYIWLDKTTTIYVQPGAEINLKLVLVKKWIRGYLKLTCLIPSAQPTDDIACKVTLDDVAQEPLLTTGQVVTYPLDAGPHKARVDLVGASAFLWAPAFREQAITIYAGQPASFTPVFTKAGHMIITTDQPSVLADFYVDGVLLGTQMAQVDVWTTPNIVHKIEAKNITELTGPTTIYGFGDSATSASVAPAEEKAVVVTLVKTVKYGLVALRCTVANPPADVSLYCLIIIDSVYRGAVLPNTTGTFGVQPDVPHFMLVIPGPTDIWTGTAKGFFFTVGLGQTVTFEVRYSVR